MRVPTHAHSDLTASSIKSRSPRSSSGTTSKTSARSVRQPQERCSGPPGALQITRRNMKDCLTTSTMSLSCFTCDPLLTVLAGPGSPTIYIPIRPFALVALPVGRVPLSFAVLHVLHPLTNVLVAKFIHFEPHNRGTCLRRNPPVYL